MVCRVTTFAFEGEPVDVQVQMTGGQPAFHIVGLPDKAVGESRERVRAAFASLGTVRRACPNQPYLRRAALQPGAWSVK